MPRKFGRIAGVVLASALSGALAGCSYLLPTEFGMGGAPPPGEGPGAPGWGQTIVVAAGYAEGETEGPYLLDSGDRLRIFIYGHPNLSRLYTVDQEGMIPVPLIGGPAVAPPEAWRAPLRHALARNTSESRRSRSTSPRTGRSSSWAKCATPANIRL
jgi:hypothetical protein